MPRLCGFASLREEILLRIAVRAPTRHPEGAALPVYSWWALLCCMAVAVHALMRGRFEGSGELQLAMAA